MEDSTGQAVGASVQHASALPPVNLGFPADRLLEWQRHDQGLLLSLQSFPLNGEKVSTDS